MNENLRNSRCSKRRSLPVIRCSCGSKILLIPSVKEMSTAIEAHIDKHNKGISDPAEAKEKSKRIRNDLIEQMFDLAFEL